jgi:hypothetical protein
MGLDSYFKIKQYHTPKFDTLPALHLCGGIMSGNGQDGSFRGKVYDQFITRVTGQSLYEFEIEHQVICNMAKALNEWNYATVSDKETYGITEEEFNDLKLLFNAAAEMEDCVLIGWW